MVRETSRKAFQELKDARALSRRQVEAVDAVRLHGPGTGREIELRAKRAGYAFDGMWKRFSELKEFGLIHETHQRKCTVTNRTASVLHIGPDPAKLNQGVQLEMFPAMTTGAYR